MSKDWTEKEIREIGRAAKYYRELGMRWCKLERIFDLDRMEIKRILCLYKELEESGVRS